MITVLFHLSGGRVTGFDCEGHSGYAPAGEDIVCAAVTSAVRLTECALNDTAGAGAAVSADRGGARVSLRLPDGLSDETARVCQILLTALLTYLRQLCREYPDHMNLSEV